MSALRERQAHIREALLGAGTPAALDGIAGDGLSPAARLAIYRHHVTTTLTDVLRSTYPVVCRLVDERFFAYAADRFISAHPPTSPCLFEYGEAFAGFLSSFEPCRHLVYLPDVARLEWAINAAEHADDAMDIDPRMLAEAQDDDLVGATLRFHPSVTLLSSPWPVDRIWRATQPDAEPEATVDLDAGGAYLEVRRRGDDVVLRTIERADYTFRRALHEGRSLGEAAEAALAVDAPFDLTCALHDLLHN
jgi:hypothetical protein